MKRSLLLALVLVPTAIACKKEVPPVPDAGTVAVALEAGPVETAPVADVDAGAAVPLTTATVKPVVKAVDAGTAAAAAGGPFQATYKCFGGMTVTQKGAAVDARTFPGKTDGYSTISCTAAGDVCTGQVTEYKGGARAGQRGATLKRNANGDITYKGDGEPQPTFCKKQ